MRITSKQKIYAAAVGLALAALAFDAVRSGPAAAPAAQPDPPSPPAGGPSGGAAVATADVPSAAPAATFAARLLGFLDGNGGLPEARDAFRPSALWDVAVPPDDQVSPRAFAVAHVLTAVIGRPGEGKALVDGTLLGLGDELDGFKLVGVSRTSAVFSRGGRTAELRTDAAGPPG